MTKETTSKPKMNFDTPNFNFSKNYQSSISNDSKKIYNNDDVKMI